MRATATGATKKGSVVRSPLGEILYDSVNFPALTWDVSTESILTVHAGLDRNAPVVGVFTPPWQIISAEIHAANTR